MIMKKIFLICILIILIGFLSHKKYNLENFQTIDVNNTDYTKIIINTNEDDGDDREDGEDGDDREDGEDGKDGEDGEDREDREDRDKSSSNNTVYNLKKSYNDINNTLNDVIDMSDYILKSSIPPPPKMPDLKDYVHKSLVPKLDDYILKSAIQSDITKCQNSDYILKSEINPSSIEKYNNIETTNPTKIDTATQYKSLEDTIKNNMEIAQTKINELEAKILSSENKKIELETKTLAQEEEMNKENNKKGWFKKAQEKIYSFFVMIYRFFKKIYLIIYNFFARLFGVKNKVTESFYNLNDSNDLEYHDIYDKNFFVNNYKNNIVSSDSEDDTIIHKQINQIASDDDMNLLDAIETHQDTEVNKTNNCNSYVASVVLEDGLMPTQMGLREPTFIEKNYKTGRLPETIETFSNIKDNDVGESNGYSMVNSNDNNILSITNSIRDRLKNKNKLIN